MFAKQLKLVCRFALGVAIYAAVSLGQVDWPLLKLEKKLQRIVIGRTERYKNCFKRIIV
jgi:hypothetical protein